MDKKRWLSLGLITAFVSMNVLGSDTKTDISTGDQVLVKEFKELKKSVDELEVRMTKSRVPLSLVYPKSEAQYLPKFGYKDGQQPFQYLPSPITDVPIYNPLAPGIFHPKNKEICLSSCCQVEIYRKWAQSLEYIENAESLDEKIDDAALNFAENSGIDECQSQAISWMIFFDAVNKND